MPLTAADRRAPLSLRVGAASLVGLGYVAVAFYFHPEEGATTASLGLIHISMAWVLALLVGGALLGTWGGMLYGIVLGFAQLPIEWLEGDGHPVAPGLLVTSVVVGLAASGLSGAFTTMQRKGRGHAAALAEKHRALQETTARLERSESLFRQFAERVDVGIWITPAEPGSPGYANPAAGRLYGANPIVADWRESIHPDDRAFVLASADRLEASGEEEIEYRLLPVQGSMRWVRARSFVVRDAEGHSTLTAGLLEDITERKERETHRDLIERRERLSALGTLMAGVAHEINNPLTYLLGNVELAQMELEKARAASVDKARIERAERLLTTSKDGGERIAKIVRSLRTVTRTASPGDRTRVALNAVASDVHALMRTSVPATVDFRLVTSADDPAVLGDSGEIAQVLLNLATNAVQAVGAEPGRVSIETRASPRGAELIVRDDGPGIPPDVRAKMFTPFFTTKPEGTGLGLSLVDTIVRDHGGEVLVECLASRPGTVFRVRFPLIEPAQKVIS